MKNYPFLKIDINYMYNRCDANANANTYNEGGGTQKTKTNERTKKVSNEKEMIFRWQFMIIYLTTMCHGMTVSCLSLHSMMNNGGVRIFKPVCSSFARLLHTQWIRTFNVSSFAKQLHNENDANENIIYIFRTNLETIWFFSRFRSFHER